MTKIVPVAVYPELYDKHISCNFYSHFPLSLPAHLNMVLVSGIIFWYVYEFNSRAYLPVKYYNVATQKKNACFNSDKANAQ